MLRVFRRMALTALAGVMLAGCSGVTDTTNNPPAQNGNPVNPAPFTVPTFDLASGDPTKLPLPIDLLRNPQTGLVSNLPNTPPFDQEPFLSLKASPGFSTTGNIIIPFTGGVDPSTVNSQTMPIFNAATNQTAPMVYGVGNPLVEGQITNSTVVAVPVLPMAQNSTYICVVTAGVIGSGGPVKTTQTITLLKRTTPLVTAGGNSTVTGLSNAQAQALEPVRIAYQPIWQAAERFTGTTRDNIPFAFSFGTQPLFGTLQALHAVAVQQNRGTSGVLPLAVGRAQVDAFYTANNLPTSAAQNINAIFTGNITMPNYIGNATTGFFQGTGAPGNPVVNQGDRPVPFFAIMPDPAKFPGPRPCLIFQHGITRTKNDVFAFADSACQAGFGVMAIDLVLHGSLALNPADPAASGQGFINLTSLRTSRDNIRQSAVDLFYVTQAVVSGQTDFDKNGTPDLAPIPPVFCGTSMGGMVGTLYSAEETNNKLGVYNVAGGRLTSLVLNSPTFGPPVIQGLAQQGITQGSTNFTAFFFIAQTVLDDADPMNYATQLLGGQLKNNTASSGLIQEYIGDTVVPNSATNDLANSMTGGSQVGPALVRLPLLSLVTAPFQGSGIFQFANSQHGAILNPALGPTAQIRTQLLTFLGSGLTGPATIINPTTTPKAVEGLLNLPESDPANAVYFGK